MAATAVVQTDPSFSRCGQGQVKHHQAAATMAKTAVVWTDPSFSCSNNIFKVKSGAKYAKLCDLFKYGNVIMLI